MSGVVEGIYIVEGRGQPMRSVAEVSGEAHRGLVGDRHFRADGAPGAPGSGAGVRNVSLVEAEVLESLQDEYKIELIGQETRRNILVRGIRLNELIGKRFRVGGLLCEGTELCEPCAHLEESVGRPVLKPLVHRGGLRARILEGGTVRVGDTVLAAEATPAT